MRRERSETLAVIGHQGTQGGAAEAVRLLQDRLEHRPRVAGRAVDGAQHLGQCRLPRQRRVALGMALVEFAPELGYLVVEDHGHLLTPLRAGPSRMLLLILRSSRRRPRRVADRCTPAARARVDGGTKPLTRMCGIIPLAGAASPSTSANPCSRRYTLKPSSP